MDVPRLITVIESNGELFRVGDIVNFAIDCGFSDRKCYGRITQIDAGGQLMFDCSKLCNSKKEKIDVSSLVSISHAAEQED